jgi:hypothetical protein
MALHTTLHLHEVAAGRGAESAHDFKTISGDRIRPGGGARLGPFGLFALI